ncbi:MAG TPA: GNAT family N-acetyltransferase [Pirellulales bacterium]|nr:GNAT family N-acetyltransferase [Pirellulales bacterium]
MSDRRASSIATAYWTTHLGCSPHDLRILQQSCDPIEWQHGGSSVEQPCSGIFVGKQLVSIAGYEVWGGSIAHLSVITHPGYRRRGFGRAATAHVALHAIEAGLLPQYRTLESNVGSLRIAKSLGFRRYATSLAIRLNWTASGE